MQGYADLFTTKISKMIDKSKIKFAARKWAIDTKKKFPHLSEPEFIAGAEWAIAEIENQKMETCDNCGRKGAPVILGEACPHCYC